MSTLKSVVKTIIFGKGFKKRRFFGGPLKGLWGYFDLANDTQVWRGIYEIAQQEWIIKATKPGATCLDVGGAEGVFALLMARSAGTSGHVITFEPTERGQFITETFAMNEASALAKLSLVPEFAIGPETTGLHGITIDEYVEKNNINRLDVVKIDVDGGEMDVLLGMQRTIDRDHPHMSVELHSPELHQQVKEFLESRGYTMNLVDPPAYELRPIPFNKFFFSELPK